MRIAILVYSLTGGGAERVAALWAKGFAERGHQVVVVVNDDKGPVTYGLSDNVLLKSVTSQLRLGILRVLDRVWKLRKLLIKEKPQVVIELMPSYERIVAMFGLKCIRISTEHNSFERPENTDDELNVIKKFYLNRLYDHVTVLTQADMKVIGNRLKHVTVMPNPLALKPARSVPPKEKVVLAVGRKDSWFYKGFDNLIRSWERVAAEAKGWKLQIVGGSNGEGQAYLERLCKECGVTDSVEFPDFQSDILPCYQQASIFVLSSRYEGFGLVLIEAMSQGCACIACDYKGRQSEILTNGKNGVTCEPDNVEVLANAIRQLIVDDERRVQLQANAIQRAADFSLGKIMDRWEEIIRTCRIKN